MFILFLLFTITVAACSALILAAVLFYFPSRPPTPPSISSTVEKYNFRRGIQTIFK